MSHSLPYKPSAFQVKKPEAMPAKKMVDASKDSKAHTIKQWKKGSWLFRVCNSSRSTSRSTSSSNGTSSTNGASSWSLQVNLDLDVSNE